jgi:hypothetical protein
MDLTEGSETSAKLDLTPGKYPKEHIQVSGGFLQSFQTWQHMDGISSLPSSCYWKLRSLSARDAGEINHK